MAMLSKTVCTIFKKISSDNRPLVRPIQPLQNKNEDLNFTWMKK